MNESSSELEGVEMRVLLCGCHGDIPDLPPGIVEGLVNGVDTRMVGGDRIGVTSVGNTMLLEREQLAGMRISQCMCNSLALERCLVVT